MSKLIVLKGMDVIRKKYRKKLARKLFLLKRKIGILNHYGNY